MTKMYKFQGEILTQEQYEYFEEVGTLAAATVEDKYGSGYPHFSGGENGGLAYHNLCHTTYVAQASERMASAIGLGQAACAIAWVAGAAHDIVQLKPRGIMEDESAAWLEERLRLRNMPPVVLRAGVLAILGTEPILENSKVVGQKVSDLLFPNKTTELVAKSVASADLAQLYDPYGPYHGHRYWQELKGRAPGEPFPMDGVVDFQRGQVVLAQEYTFPHRIANRLFGKLRPQVVEHQERLLHELEAGNIDSGAVLLAADLAFARQHSQ